jgi:hypothetical protein
MFQHHPAFIETLVQMKQGEILRKVQSFYEHKYLNADEPIINLE